MKKTVKAVRPYIHPGHLNFKLSPYEAWVENGGKTSCSLFPPDIVKGFFFKHSLPKICENTKEARLRFVEAYSVQFDTFPDYAFYEIIPFVWDCWPNEFEKFCRWIEKYKVKTVFFTCEETSIKIKKRYPGINSIYCPEGIDSSIYDKGLELKDRNIDLFEFGRGSEGLFNLSFPDSFLHIKSFKEDGGRMANGEFMSALKNSKITICYPHSYTDKIKTGGLETLTQRYWECMLSRMVIVGHAPRELVDFIGYNPVIELDVNNPSQHIMSIVNDIKNYQELVDKNRKTAEQMSDWKFRIQFIMSELKKLNYSI